jgi:hypothetical protein
VVFRFAAGLAAAFVLVLAADLDPAFFFAVCPADPAFPFRDAELCFARLLLARPLERLLVELLVLFLRVERFVVWGIPASSSHPCTRTARTRPPERVNVRTEQGFHWEKKCRPSTSKRRSRRATAGRKHAPLRYERRLSEIV